MDSVFSEQELSKLRARIERLNKMEQQIVNIYGLNINATAERLRGLIDSNPDLSHLTPENLRDLGRPIPDEMKMTAKKVQNTLIANINTPNAKLTSQQVEEMVRFLPQNFIFGEVSYLGPSALPHVPKQEGKVRPIKYLVRDRLGARYNLEYGKRGASIEIDEKNIVNIETLIAVILHEIGHMKGLYIYSDVKLDPEIADQNLLDIWERLNSPDAYPSEQVGVNMAKWQKNDPLLKTPKDVSAEQRLDLASQYMADIVARAFFHYKSLPLKDFKIVERTVNAYDPNFNWDQENKQFSEWANKIMAKYKK